LETLDQRHEHFLQSDLAEFARYRTNLDTFTIGTNGAANLTPAMTLPAIPGTNSTARDHVNELLQEDKFKFNTDEHILLDRRHASYPKTSTRQNSFVAAMRYDICRKLSREISPTNSDVICPCPIRHGGNR